MIKNETLENLEAQLVSTPKNTRKYVDVLNDLAWETWSTDRERAEALTEESAKLARALKYAKGIAYNRLNKGLAVWPKDIEEALHFIIDAQEWFQQNQEKKGDAYATNILAVMYWNFGDFQKGFELVNQSLGIYKEIDEPEGEAWAYNILSGFYYDRKEYKETLDYSRKALALFEQTGNPIGEARALNGIGKAFQFMGDSEKALEYQEKSTALARKMDNVLSISRSLHDMGLIYRSMGDYKKALTYFEESRELREKQNYGPGLSTTLIDIGWTYCMMDRHPEAIEMFNEGLELSKKMKSKQKIIRALEGLGKVHELEGQFEEALEMHKELHQIFKDASQSDTAEKMQRIKTVYEVETSKKEAEIYRLKNVELREKNERLEETIRMLNATQAQLVQSGKMVALGNLVAGIAHEINTPIGTIKSGNDLSEKIANRLLNSLSMEERVENIEKELQKTLSILQQSSQNNAAAAERIIKIIQSLKNFARLDEADFLKTDIHEGLDSTLTLIGHEIGGRVDVERKYGKLPEVYAYANELNQVFMNLLLNAIQATPEGGKISIRTFRNNGNICVSITDTGKGIPQDKLATLFEPGFTKDSSRVKMRTGLYTTYNIISKHHGDITVDSEVGKGTTFTIHIPANLNEESILHN